VRFACIVGLYLRAGRTTGARTKPVTARRRFLRDRGWRGWGGRFFVLEEGAGAGGLWTVGARTNPVTALAAGRRATHRVPRSGGAGPVVRACEVWREWTQIMRLADGTGRRSWVGRWSCFISRRGRPCRGTTSIEIRRRQ